jgi:cytochrome P450
MSLTQTTDPPAPATPAQCPVDHRTFGSKKSVRPSAVGGGAPLQQDARGGWQVRGFEEARAILRSPATRQAGFKAEMVTAHAGLTNPPILYQHGKSHQEQRAKTARFFAPKTVIANYRRMMETLADHLVARVRRERRADLSELSMTLAVQVASQVVGLTNSPLRGRVRRLEAFFNQADVAERPTVLSRIMQFLNLGRLLLFYWRDVRPAIRARRRHPQEDVITHLLAQNYSDREILTECVTFAAAGMATTREFVVMAAWHLLEQPALRARYRVAGDAEREAILHEILRLEPVVGHLYRRATEEVTVTSAGQPVTIPSGALIDLNIEAVNLDERVVGADPQAVCPARPLTGDRVGAMLMSFGDGAHRCPGAYLAIQETDIFLRRLLALDGLRIVQPPVLTWNDVTAGYELRRCIVSLDPA